MPDRIKKFIDSLDEKMKNKLRQRLAAIKKNPFDGDIKKLKGWGPNVYRARLGNIRIIYNVTGQEVEIIDIDYCGNIY